MDKIKSGNNRDKRKRFAHILAGVVILIHAYEKYEGGHHSYVLFAMAGTVFLAIAFLHPVIEKKAPWIDGVFLIIEGLLSIVIAIDFFHAGKWALPFAYLLLSVFQFYMAFKKSRAGIELHRSSQ